MGTQTHPRVPWKGMETPDSRNVAGQPCPGLASVCPNGPMSMLGLAQPPLGGGEYREGACVGPGSSTTAAAHYGTGAGKSKMGHIHLQTGK